MPTGYTAELVEKGQSFREFVMRCARAFGALIEMGDEPLDAEIQDFKASSYYTESIAQHEANLKSLQLMSNDERIVFGKSAKKRAIAMSEKSLEEYKVQNSRLQEMEDRVIDWTPPTPDHQELKRFMLEQIKISRNDTSYTLSELESLRSKTVCSFYAEAVRSAERGIGYSKKELRKEVDRMNERNEWVKRLRESIRE